MILIDNIGVLATLTDDGEINDAAMLVDGEFIAWCGKKSALPSQAVTQTIDAKGCLVIPDLIDCHTHLLCL